MMPNQKLGIEMPKKPRNETRLSSMATARDGTPHPDPPPQGGREQNGVAPSYPLPLDGGGLGWGWGRRRMPSLHDDVGAEDAARGGGVVLDGVADPVQHVVV